MGEIQTLENKLEVSNGDLLVFIGMSKENTDALYYSHLFSSLAASAEYFPTTESEDWFKAYVLTMQTCGWLPIKFKQVNEHAISQSLSVDKLLVKGVQMALSFATGGASAGAAVMDVASDAIDTLAESPDAIKLLERDNKGKDGIALNMAVCKEFPTGEVVLSVGCVQSDEAPPSTNNLLFFEWSSSHSKTYTGAAALAFHRSLYDQIKDTLILRVGERSKHEVINKPITPKQRVKPA
ncbi:hypothetical protein [Pseudomonas sp. NUPR-001]|uniref:hypothetical protein n=1 Tax=Pseudomonas sp. NUPR-001 TaxID=3416058 RepID=UPI003F959B3D